MDRYIQALSFELSIMDRLLERHRCSHGRAIYFRRISMVVQAVRKGNLVHQLGDRFQSLDHATVEYCQRGKRKRADDQWDVRGAILTSEQRLIRENFETLQSLLTNTVQELLSRIDHASPVLFLEVNRGFFLPFCTVALATLARTRALLVRIGRIGLSKLQSMFSVEECLRKFLTMTMTRIEACMTQYLREDQEPDINGTEIGLVSFDERRAVLMKSLGFTFAKTKTCSIKMGPPARKMDEGVTEELDAVELDTSVHQDQERVKSASPPPSRLSTGDNYVGECLDFSPKTGMAFVDLKSKASASDTSRDADPMDRNMEILETLKAGGKREKKRNDQKTSKKTKKKKSSGDFFDALFG